MAIKKVVDCTVGTLQVVGHVPRKISSVCSIFQHSLVDSAADLLKELFGCDI